MLKFSPSAQKLSLLYDNELDDTERGSLNKHIESCEESQKILSEWSEFSQPIQKLLNCFTPNQNFSKKVMEILDKE